MCGDWTSGTNRENAAALGLGPGRLAYGSMPYTDELILKRKSPVPTGSATPRAELGRTCCPIFIPRGGPGHGGLISYRGLSAMRTAVFPGRWRASRAKGCVLSD